MTRFQKVIKYFAIALATYLIINIIMSIFFGLSIFSNVLGITTNNPKNEVKENISISKEKYTSLDIDISSTNLTIEYGKNFEIISNNDKIITTKKNNKLYILEKEHKIFKNNNNALTIIIPRNTTLNEVQIDSGAGNIQINGLNTNNLSLDFGAGKATINNLYVNNKTEIDIGTGEVIIDNGIINNLDLDGGVGNFILNAKLTGNNQISTGIGNLSINLLDSLNNYKIKTERGIGKTKLNNSNIKNNIVYGTGINLIDIEGGIGNIEINTTN